MMVAEGWEEIASAIDAWLVDVLKQASVAAEHPDA
jgi:hypothetical protein